MLRGPRILLFLHSSNSSVSTGEYLSLRLLIIKKGDRVPLELKPESVFLLQAVTTVYTVVVHPRREPAEEGGDSLNRGVSG